MGKFYENLPIPLDYWTIEDYEKQWREGLERIKKYDKSCLVVRVHNPKKNPIVMVWILYKENNNIFIQNELWLSDEFLNKLTTMPFNLKNCYNFLDSHKHVSEDEDGEIAEWNLSLKDIDDALEELNKDSKY